MTTMIPSGQMSRVARLHAIAVDHFKGASVPHAVQLLIQDHRRHRISPVRFAGQLDAYREVLKNEHAPDYSFFRLALILKERPVDRRTFSRLTGIEITEILRYLDEDTIEKYRLYIEEMKKRPKLKPLFPEVKIWCLHKDCKIEDAIKLLCYVAKEVDPVILHLAYFGEGILRVSSRSTEESVMANHFAEIKDKRDRNERAEIELSAYKKLLESLRSAPCRDEATLISDLTARASKDFGEEVFLDSLICIAVQTLSHPDEIAMFVKFLKKKTGSGAGTELPSYFEPILELLHSDIKGKAGVVFIWIKALAED